ncbi:UNVERIFIED_CONTAM: hypothetical protein FKN15_023470 [Acipenser sinensis]
MQTPFFLMYSRKARLACEINPDDIDLVAPRPPTEEKIQEYLEARAAKNEEVKMQVEKAQERRSSIGAGSREERSASGSKGMKVLKKNERKTGCLGSKLEQNWLGHLQRINVNLYLSFFCVLLGRLRQVYQDSITVWQSLGHDGS